MDSAPRKTDWVTTLRRPLYSIEKYLPGDINPNIWTAAMMLPSVLFIFTPFTTPWNILCIISAMILDWLDGAYARKRKSTSMHGHIVDITFDKLSEVLIITPFIGTWFGVILLVIFLLNLYFTKRIFTTNQHFHLNTRFIVILYLLTNSLTH